MSILNNYSAYYAFTRDNMFKQPNAENLSLKPDLGNKSSMFTLNYRYSYEFQGIMPDSRATRILLAGKPQVLAL